MSAKKEGTMREKLKVQIDENLYDFLELCFPSEEMEKRQKRLQEHNYLEKGVRIEDLARKKQHRSPLLCYAQKEMNIFRISTKGKEKSRYFLCALEKTERELRTIVSAAKSEEEFLSSALPILKKVLGIYADDILLIPEREAEYDPGYGLCKNSGAYTAVKLVAKGTGEEMVRFCPVGGKGKVKQGFWYYTSYPSENAYINTFFDALAAVVVIGKLQEALWEQCGNKDGKIYRLAEEMVVDLFRYDYQIGKLTDEVFQQYLVTQGYELDYKTLTYRKYGNDRVIDLDLVLGDEMLHERMQYMFLRCLCERRKLPVECIFRRRENPKNGQDGMAVNDSYAVRDLLCRLYLMLYEEYEEYTDQEAYERMLNKSVATAYMTKKNIPKVMLKEMEQSRFNRYFGYVEYDEDVDIKAARTVADEFVEMNERLFFGIENPNCAIRLRKLGKHRALGVYFPQLNCMCVDIHSPDSFLHEYYHLLDDQLGNLSSRYEFHHICREYRELLMMRIRKDKELDKALSGNSKYNLKYYLRPTEIFARCGEMYLQRIKGVKSSLLKPALEDLFAYPESDAFNEMIKKYFDALHESLENKMAA